MWGRNELVLLFLRPLHSGLWGRIKVRLPWPVAPRVERVLVGLPVPLAASLPKHVAECSQPLPRTTDLSGRASHPRSKLLVGRVRSCGRPKRAVAVNRCVHETDIGGDFLPLVIQQRQRYLREVVTDC